MIKITETNKAKIQAIIDAVQGPRVKARTIAADDVFHAVRLIQGKLLDILNTKDWHGLSFYVDPNAQKFPSSYKGTPESTAFSVIRLTASWQLKWVERRPTGRKVFTVYGMACKAVELADFVEDNF